MSMFLDGSGFRVPSSCRSNCVKTRFHISTNRLQSCAIDHAGSSGLAQFGAHIEEYLVARAAEAVRAFAGGVGGPVVLVLAQPHDPAPPGT